MSLQVATLAVVLLFPIALAISWLLARRNFAGKTLLDVAVHLPLVLPPVLTGYLLLITFGRKGPLGSAFEYCCGIVFSFRWTGAALAAAIMALPLMVRAIRLAIESIDPRLENAASTLGSSPLKVFATVTLPLAAPGLLAGILLAFAKALGEFGATITFVSSIPGETETIALQIYTLTQVPGGEAAIFRLATVSVILSFATLVASELLARRIKRRLSA